MKKFGIAVMMVVLTGMMVFGGGNQARATDPSAPVTLTVWCWDPNFSIYIINEAAKIYKAIKPNVIVNCVEVSWGDIQQRLITAFSARQYGDLPDIICMPDSAIQKNVMTYPDRFLQLNDKVNLSQFAQYKLDVGNYNGKNYGVPFDNGTTGTFIRRDIVERAGFKIEDFNNITWERFFELGKIVKQKTGIPMLSVDVGTTELINVMLQSAGTWYFDSQGKTNIKNNPALRRALELVIQGLRDEIIIQVNDWNSYIASLNNGSVASTVQGAWIIASITAEVSQSGNWAVVTTPRMGSISSSVNYSSNGGSGWMVLANSKNPDTAMDFLDKTFAGSVQLYETILPSTGCIAVWLPAANSPAYSRPHQFFGGQKIFEDLVNYSGKVPRVKYGIFNYEAQAAVTRIIPDIIGGRMTIDAALDAAQREVDFIVSQ